MAALFIVNIPTEDHELMKQRSGHSKCRLGVSANGHIARENRLKPAKVLMEEVLEIYKLGRSTWRKTMNAQFYQVIFQVDSQRLIETVLNAIEINLIVHNPGSSVSVVPCSIVYEGGNKHSNSTSREFQDDLAFKKRKSAFLKSITARLTVAQVVDGVKAGGELSFDFLIQILVAGMVAAVAFMDDNNFFFVASMLLCPLMGPLMSLTFGIMIRDRLLTGMAIRSESIGLILSVIAGFLLGLIFAPWQEAWQKGPWPTNEMDSLGVFKSLWVGALVAIPSGAGAALSLLWDNMCSLIGVAIALSLLPPCINTGILWANSALIAIKGIHEEGTWTTYFNRDSGNSSEIFLKPSYFSPANYSYSFSYNHAKECWALGAISFGVAIVNVIFIVLSALLVLKIKEVSPMKNHPLSRFWKEDIKIARDYNRSIVSGDSSSIGRTLREEWVQLHNMSPMGTPQSIHSQRKMKDLTHIMEDIEQDVVYKSVVRSMSQRLASKHKYNSSNTLRVGTYYEQYSSAHARED